MRAQWTNTDVKKMREYRNQGMSYKDLVKTFGGSVSTACRACHGETYKTAGGPVAPKKIIQRSYYRSVL